MGRTRFELLHTTMTAAHPAALAAPRRLADLLPSARLASPANDSTPAAAHARPAASPLRLIALHTAATPVARPSLSMTPAPFACVPERADHPRRPDIASARRGGSYPASARRLASPARSARHAASLLTGSPTASLVRPLPGAVASRSGRQAPASSMTTGR